MPPLRAHTGAGWKLWGTGTARALLYATAGAQKAGYEIESWAVRTRRMNARPEAKYSVYLSGPGVFDLSRETGKLASGVEIRYGLDRSCDYLVLLNRRGFIERGGKEILDYCRNRNPELSLRTGVRRWLIFTASGRV